VDWIGVAPENGVMRALTVIGIGVVLTAGCGDRSNSGPRDAGADRADGDAATDTAARPDAADAPADHPPADATAADASEGGLPDAPLDTATADTATADTATADTATGDTASADSARSDATDATDAPGEGGNADARPPDPCASNSPLSTVGCNGEPPGPAAPNTFGGLCSYSDASAAGSCINPNHLCVEGMCAPLCEPTRTTEVSTGGCPPGSRCWNTGLLAFCFPDCRAAADCASARCDSGRDLCRGP
jgi:hypothetical protein